jgi:hypothetical protein
MDVATYCEVALDILEGDVEVCAPDELRAEYDGVKCTVDDPVGVVYVCWGTSRALKQRNPT